MLIRFFSLHKKWSFPLRISSVNVTNSAGIWSHCICWRNPQWKTSFFVQRFFFEIFSRVYELICKRYTRRFRYFLCNCKIFLNWNRVLENKVWVLFLSFNQFFPQSHEMKNICRSFLFTLLLWYLKRFCKGCNVQHDLQHRNLGECHHLASFQLR